ncbi:MAG TPA: peptidylprolyl isomerase, partial [Acidiferrobacteraceae bacterium]|nr:peptidylprolyl isomerase [Acidiferrobacteraceae bacterium]
MIAEWGHGTQRSRILLMLSFAALVGCSRTPNPDHSAVLARVNGRPITRAALDYYLRVRAAVAPLPVARGPARRLALDEMINTEVLADAARREHLNEDPDIHFALVQDRLNLLAHALVNRYLKQHPISSAELAVAYHQQYKDGGVVEYRARHILVRTRARAQQILQQLQQGARFGVLARKYSEDTVSADNGGELGWFTKDQMLPAFVAGVADLKPGEISPQPIRTEFGWHIVQLEGRRMAAA